MFKKNIIVSSVAIALGGVSFTTQATEWITTIEATDDYGGSTGTITFDDWGFSDQKNGRDASQFDAINGFGEVGQIQHVVTKDPDFISPDSPSTVVQEWETAGVQNTYTNASMDAGVNFYQWGYTTEGGSTFNNMKIDKDGDYFVAQEDMTFQLYDSFDYHQVETNLNPGDEGYVANLYPGDEGYLADGVYPTKIAFQPYVLSDAKGWCGSVMASNPAALEAMAGQISFDFAFDVYFQIAPGTYLYSSTEIVRDFEMRSYGTISVDVTTAGGDVQKYSASAVVNNTNPALETDPLKAMNDSSVDGAEAVLDYYNQVSFMGAGVLSGTDYCGQLTPGWSGGVTTDTSTYKFSGIIDGVADAAACSLAGGEWQSHNYTGFSYILRADGTRVIEAMDYSEYDDLSLVPHVVNGVAYNYDENGDLIAIADLSAVPVPAAVWLFGSGLLGMIGISRRRKRDIA